MNVDDHKGWYSRKGLPHFDAGEIVQFITFRLHDSLPQSQLDVLSDELKNAPGNNARHQDERIQELLDQGAGSCLLKQPQCAEIVQSALLYLDGRRYDLRAWVVMPNHVHFLARFEVGQSLSKALHSLKSFTAHEIRKLHPSVESVWQKESFDRFIRNDDHYHRTVAYIHSNPVSAKLCLEAESFRYSSARLVE
jgi:putative transposase